MQSPTSLSHADASDVKQTLLKTIWRAAGGELGETSQVSFTGHGHLPSFFAVTELAAASMGAAGLALAELLNTLHQASGRQTKAVPRVIVDQRLASFWFASTLRPEGWKPPQYSEVAAADYQAQDGWLRLHTNASHHLQAALRVLQCSASPEAMARAVSTWKRDALEARILAQGGCAATMLTPEQWTQHPQGQALCQEPLIDWTPGAQCTPGPWAFETAQPLKGLKVLDMTRVLAGPAATRMLAGLGAQVLRLDAPMWDESNAAEMTLGKYCAELDLREAAQRAHWTKLLSEADVLVHGYRSDALASMGLDAQARQHIRPGLIDISLDAYGFTGPWHNRRGFDSLVQMSIGIAQSGQRLAQSGRPLPLPVQALDHATGYLLATAALRGLETRVNTGRGSIARASLARTGALLVTTMDPLGLERPRLAPETPEDLSDQMEHTGWGLARRIRWPVTVSGVTLHWPLGAGPLKRHTAQWV
jgi:crotonobetainyl-CoA:carnitine CoA-transferase CaiB-like acyl-CoA transferase